MVKFSSFILSFTGTLVLIGCSIMPDGSVSSKNAYYTIKDPIQCVPYARGISGISIYGDAHTWWPQAKGRYQRGHKPKKAAVLVLSKTERMRYGHIAVVKRIIDARHIEVTHSNWGNDKKTRSVIYEKMRVKDISANNDWSKVRFWNYPSGSYGRSFIVSGFIYAD